MQYLRLLTISLSMLMFFSSNFAFAHKPSDSYLSIKVEENHLQGRWDISLRDLDFAFGLDSDDNGELTWGEVRAKHNEIAFYASSRLKVSIEGKPCSMALGEQMLEQHSDGTYIVVFFKLECANNADIQIDYSLLFDVDPQHKGLLKLTNAANEVSTAIFTPDNSSQIIRLSQPTRFQQLIDYIKLGVFHIWVGFDHILFLISLLLPAVLLRVNKKWAPGANFKTATIDVLKIVTAFTLAHSITLTLAALHIIILPTRWVESTIALSVILAAMNNIIPIFQGKRWLLAFIFGLIHGFGFASVLADLGLEKSSLVFSLIGFNLGVETGQLAIVAVFLPMTFVIRKSMFYQRLVVCGGSILIIAVSLIWLIERVFDIVIFKF